MKQELITLPEFKLIGLTVRTNNKNETDPKISKIGQLAGRFWQDALANQISNRKNPGTTFSVYTDYESDEHGDYTYFIGEEVSSLKNVPTGFVTLAVPAFKYKKFTTAAGKMPEVVINAWQHIWKMSPKDLGGKRAYQADFEVYDERAANPSSTSLDIYVGIK